VIDSQWVKRAHGFSTRKFSKKYKKLLVEKKIVFIFAALFERDG
jgi:hypothetical protein